jgi:DNA-binding response OmpR family regulator
MLNLPVEKGISHHILVVDDDAEICRLVGEYLGEYHLRVSSAFDGRSMRRELERNVIHLVVLDIKLPDENGMTIARELRQRSSVPIIMLTSCNDDADRIMGLELGADDYLTKPFSPRELLARVRALLRRSYQRNGGPGVEGGGLQAFRFAGWELDLRSRRLTAGSGEHVSLTRAEFLLLSAFLGAPQRILSREQLLELSRGADEEVFDRSIDVQILRLRRKIETDPSRPQLIRTERGAGYCFTADVEVVG